MCMTQGGGVLRLLLGVGPLCQGAWGGRRVLVQGAQEGASGSGSLGLLDMAACQLHACCLRSMATVVGSRGLATGQARVCTGGSHSLPNGTSRHAKGSGLYAETRHKPQMRLMKPGGVKKPSAKNQRSWPP